MAEQPLRELVVGDDASVREVLTAIGRHEVGCALMVDGHRRLLGVIRDRDVLRALLDGYSLDSPAIGLAEPPGAVVAPGEGRAAVVELMQARSLRLVPVLGPGGELVGAHLADELLGPRRLPNWAVIMAGGRGQRLAPLTDAVPKPMLPVAGRPILERLVLHLVGQGITRVFLSVNYLREQIERHFGNGRRFGCDISYLREDPDVPLGSGGALALLAERGYTPADPLVVMNGDLVTDLPVGDVIGSHLEQGAMATMVVHEHTYQVPFGVVEREGAAVARLVEKPTQRWLVNAGVYVLEPALLERLPGGPMAMTELFDDCLRRDEPVHLWEMRDAWQDIGRPHELAKAQGRLS